jgi:LemA protein
VTIIIVLVLILVLLVILVLWVAGMYNGLVRLRNLVQEAWRQIDVELKRRHDLIPNLVETVKGYATHERQALDSVVTARAAAASTAGSVEQQAAAEGALSAALGRLFAVAEAYPDLKANQNYLALQTELTETEDRVAAGRRFYNANVRELNTRVESFPSNLFASTFGFNRAEYFEVADITQRDAPQVSFGQASSPALGGQGAQRGIQAPAPGGGEYTVPGSSGYEQQSPPYGEQKPPYGTPPA